jgi:hypothetical protein
MSDLNRSCRKYILALVFVGLCINARADIDEDKDIDEVSAQETAISKVLIFPLKSGDASEIMHKQVVQLLNVRSYLKAEAFDKDLPTKPDLIRDAVKKAACNGFILGTIRKNELALELRSATSLRVISLWKIPLPAGVKEKDKIPLTFLEEVVQNIVTSIPYRGFILSSRNNHVRLNFGKSADVQIGKELKVFDFEGNKPTFSSTRKFIGTIRIKSVTENTAVAEIIDSEQPIDEYAKIAFDEYDLKYTTPTRSSSASHFWMGAGGSSLYLSSSGSESDPDLNKRLTKINLTPFVNLSMGQSRWRFNAAAGKADNTSQGLTLISASTTVDFISRSKHRWTFNTGFGVGAVTQTVQAKIGEASLASYQSYYPIISESANWIISSRGRIFSTIELHYPYYSSDENGLKSSLAVSYGLLLSAGLHLDLGRRWALESLFTNDYSHQKIDGNGSTTQNIFYLTMRGLYFFY